MIRKILFFGSGLFCLVLMGAGCFNLGTQAQGPMGIFRSDDSGETWLSKSAMPTLQGVQALTGMRVYRIFTDPNDTNALYVGARDQGLFYSYDNAETWKSSDFMSGKFIYAVTVDPKDKCTIYASDGQHIYKTADCMRSWTLSFTEERPNQRFAALVSDPNDSQTLYGAELGGDVLRSQDGGLSWRIIKRFDFELRHLAVDPQTPNRIYVASYNRGLYRSDDGGENWTDLSKGFDNFSDSMSFYRLILDPARKDSLFWVSKYGILRSDDAGSTWSALNLLTPPGSVNIYAFAVNPGNDSELYYTGTILGDNNVNVRSTLYKSVDGGKNWVTKKLPTNTIPVDLMINKENNKMIFMGFTTL